MGKPDPKKARRAVREACGNISKGPSGCCGTGAIGIAKAIGYSEEELKSVPGAATQSLGCGNPTVLAVLREGEVVLDLGCGRGLDVLLAARKVGPAGRIIGVDRAPGMIRKARVNAKKAGIDNADFRLGEIEKLPVADASVDVVISNCVINLSTDKEKVFQEIFRVLNPGGRIAITDLALARELPASIREDLKADGRCAAGAILAGDYMMMVEYAGFENVQVSAKGASSCVRPDTQDPFCQMLRDGLGTRRAFDAFVVSVFVEGRKPQDGLI